jgi:sortase (surface protein transpeptidase)
VEPAQAAEPAATALPAAAAPVRVDVPALGVDTAVIPVGVDDDGQLEVPEDVNTVGWYQFGPAPGAPAGSAVLTGHVDDVRQGVGVFGRIGDLGPGDAVTVTDAGGVARNFTVLSREEWNKTEVPLDRLFDRAGEPRLVLITCGGAFDNSTLGYDDNIAITAVPAAG